MTALMATASCSGSASGNEPSSRPRRRISISERSRFVGVDHREVHPQLLVVHPSEHVVDPGLELLDGAARHSIDDAIQAIGERVALLPQHRQEQFVLGREVAIERPGGHPGALQDRGNRDRTGMRFRQAAVGGVDDAAAGVVAGGTWLHGQILGTPHPPGRISVQIVL
jgi:hypothetical protein